MTINNFMLFVSVTLVLPFGIMLWVEAVVVIREEIKQWNFLRKVKRNG